MGRLRAADRLVLPLVFIALAAGGVAYAAGRASWASWLWAGGTILGMADLTIEVVAGLAQRQTGLDIIALLSMAGATALREYLTGAVVALMFAGGQALEDWAEGRARREMTALLSRVPKSANRYQGEALVRVPLESVRPGDRLLVRSGDTVPVDGSVAGGTAVLDASALTGEAMPVRCGPGQPILSGSVNAAGPFDMVAAAPAAESTMARIVRLVADAQQSKPPAARLADRYALLFVPLSLSLAGLAWVAAGDPIRALAVLVVATPCPLILGVPVAIVSGMSACAARGVLVKGGGVLEKLAQARTLLFDKTGTLTGGRARVVAIEADPSLGSSELLRLAASLDQMSSHVVADGVVAAARDRGLPLATPTKVDEAPGAGVTGIVDGRRVVVGSHAYVSGLASPTAWSGRLLERTRSEGGAGVFVAADGVVVGALLLADEIRPETPRALRLLRKAGITRIAMLTGDDRDVAEAIGTALGVDEVRANLSPESKLAAIREFEQPGATIMVGDGVNDAPALAAADVGVAMGARGAAAAAEAAGVVLLVDRLDRLADAVRIARASRAIAVQSVVAGMALSGIAMVVAASGYLPPLAGAVLQEVIDVGVILNALRALRAGTRHAGRTGLSGTEALRLKSDHTALTPVIEQVRSVADQLATLPPEAIGRTLADLIGQLKEQVLAHERRDESELYPLIADMLGGDDPMAALSGMHREIIRLSRRVSRMTASFPPEGPDPATTQELQRLLYGLDAILRLHFAEEEAVYDALAEAA